MINLSAEIDTSKFDEAWKKSVELTTRSLPEFINGHAYFVARNAVGMTKAADKEKIAADLMKPSDTKATAPLAAIFVNKERGNKGQPGLKGPAMQTAVEKYIRRRESFRNFLRAGWIPAVKKLAAVVKSKRGQPQMPTGVKPKGQEKGGANPAEKVSWNPSAEIWNSVQGGMSDSETAAKEIKEGLQKAVDKEAASMLQHAEEKLREGFLPFNAA